jgi:hypothetical protein
MISQKKKLLLEFQNNICECCKNKFESKDLHIHRINRGCSYEEMRSLMVVCHKCHRKIHQNEFL